MKEGDKVNVVVRRQFPGHNSVESGHFVRVSDDDNFGSHYCYVRLLGSERDMLVWKGDVRPADRFWPSNASKQPSQTLR